jgi:DNA polymerase-3 subunit gamma/tau
MTYQVLARKWRPGTFSDLVGQAHVLKPLTHALDNQRLHHAYLFTGTRGVGKTTLARILARCLNCDKGISSTPCGSCEACKEISEGRFIDLIEVDAASRTKVEDTRELLENVQYAPSRGRFKIYLIDEVHMLSTHSFNALLKTLEEPPPHVKFLLATTDPQKLPVTILSRCLQFNLKNLSPLQIEEYLEDILGRESIKFEEAALWQLANGAAGSMRDALTLLDQAISFCEGEVTAAGVSDMLGTPEQGVVWQLLDGLAAKDTAGLLEAVRQVAERAPDFQQLLDAMLAVLHRLAIAQVLPDAIDNSYGDREQVLETAGRISPEDIQLFYQFALKGRTDLNLAQDSRAMFEMLLIRLLVFAPEGVPTVPKPGQGDTAAPEPSIGSGKQKKKSLKSVRNIKALPEPQSAGEEQPTPVKAVATKTRKAAHHVLDTPPAVAADGLTGTGAVEVPKPGTAEPPDSDPAERQKPDLAESPAPSEVSHPELPARPGLLDNQNWIALYQHLHPGGITGNIMAHCVIDRAAEESLHLCLDSRQSAVFSEEHRSRIEQLLAGYFQCTLELFIEIGAPACESPAAFNQRIKREQLEQLRNRFEQDNNVKKLVETFSGEILQETISPV